MPMKFSEHSLSEMKHVHPELIVMATEALIYCAGGGFDFMVFDGIRTEAEQRKNIAKGVSWTMDSYHLPQQDGLGYALDLVPFVDGQVRWDSKNRAQQKRIDSHFEAIADGCKRSIDRHGFLIDWGFDLWGKDRPHWQRKRFFTGGSF
jgi:peptidoglycan LD-endopeptidase CwlK